MSAPWLMVLASLPFATLGVCVKLASLVNARLQYLGIAFAFGYGVPLFDDRITLMAVAGMVLIVAAGLGAAQLRQKGRAARRAAFLLRELTPWPGPSRP